jgi:hypothetical protein
MSLVQIRAHVAVSMRDAVVESTPFDRASYHEALVPSGDFPQGWKANEPNWALILNECEGLLRHRYNYAVPATTVDLVRKTIDKPLVTTNNNLAKAISEGKPVA